LRALDRIEKENAPQHQAAHRAHQTRVQVAKEAMRRWRKPCQEAVNANPPGDPPAMPIDAVDIGDFIEPALHVQDATIQRLGKLCVARPRGMMVIRDELSGLFAGTSRQLGARAVFLESWNGRRFVVERVDDSRSFTVPNLLVGVVGGFQPDTLARAFAGDEDGMSGRFLYSWPATPGYCRLGDEISEVDPQFQALLMRLIRLPDEDVDARFAPRVIPLARAARDRFEDYRRYVDNLKRSLDGRERQWLVKSETQTLRLAAVLSYLDWASSPPSGAGLEVITAAMEPDEISEHSMVDAIALVRGYFWLHARAAMRQIGLSDKHKHLRRALRWIRANRLSVVSLKDIRREALGGSLDCDETRDLLDRLVIAGWLRLEKTETGGRPRERWLTNPRLLETAPAGTAGTAQRFSAATFCSFLQFLQFLQETIARCSRSQCQLGHGDRRRGQRRRRAASLNGRTVPLNSALRDALIALKARRNRAPCRCGSTGFTERNSATCRNWPATHRWQRRSGTFKATRQRSVGWSISE
jgi:hypothetical protein